MPTPGGASAAIDALRKLSASYAPAEIVSQRGIALGRGAICRRLHGALIDALKKPGVPENLLAEAERSGKALRIELERGQ